MLTVFLLAVLLVLEQTARLGCPTRINRSLAHVDVLDDAFFIDDKRRAVRETFVLVQNPVFLGDGSLKVAQKRELDSNLVGERFVCGGTVNADAEHLCTALF